MENKRGQGLSTSAIILIVLGVIVLVLLIVGFTMGWKTFLPFIKTNNVETIVTSCNLACSSNSQYDFCSFKRELKTEENTFNNVSCYALSIGDDFEVYGVKECQNIGCRSVVECSDLASYTKNNNPIELIVNEKGVTQDATKTYCKL